MNLNILLILFLILMIFKIKDGYKKGMVREIISFVSLIIMCIVVVLIGNGINSYFDGEILNVIVMVLLLCVIGIVHHLLGVVFFSAKVISKLPIISWVDKLLGIIVGFLETLIILWTVYVFIMLMETGGIGQLILDNTQDSRILSWLYQHNYLAYFIEQISSKIHF